MKLSVHHRTLYRYAEPVRRSTQYIRLTPVSGASQQVSDWRVELPDTHAVPLDDAFGNATYLMTLSRVHQSIELVATGTVEVPDTDDGEPAGAMHPRVFLRASAMTELSPEILGFAESLRTIVASRPLIGVTELMHAVRHQIRLVVPADGGKGNGASDTTAGTAAAGAGAAASQSQSQSQGGGSQSQSQGTGPAVATADPEAIDAGAESATEPPRTAAEVFAASQGSWAGQVHVFLACARSLGMPARHVCGYVFSQRHEQVRCRSWAEVWLGNRWVAFDIGQGREPDGGRIRLATGLDHLDACPVRGVRVGGGAERLSHVATPHRISPTVVPD